MKTKRSKTLRLVSSAAVLAAIGLALGACASREEHELYKQIAFPENRAKPAGQQPAPAAPAFDRMGGGEGGGGGGGGGH